MLENSLYDQKSLLALTQEKPNWNSVFKDAVAFSNASGGTIIFGIEDNQLSLTIGVLVKFLLIVHLLY